MASVSARAPRAGFGFEATTGLERGGPRAAFGRAEGHGAQSGARDSGSRDFGAWDLGAWDFGHGAEIRRGRDPAWP